MKKLTLFVSSDCNLKCSYCYVNCKHQHTEIYSKDTFREKLMSFIEDSGRCDQIQFFGGEPTLELNLIESIIKDIENLCLQGKLLSKPSYGIVTNGCILDKHKAIKLLKDKNIKVTVSIDGPPHIHNFLRPARNPSYDSHQLAQDFIKELILNKIDVAAETVYTSYHLKQNYSLVDLFKHMKGIGVKSLYFDPAYPPAPLNLIPYTKELFPRLIDNYMEAIEFWFYEMIHNNNLFIKSGFNDILNALLTGLPSSKSDICPAGSTNFALDRNFNKYYCSLFYNYPEFIINKEEKKNFPKYHGDFEECSNCMVKHWCRPCPAMNLRFGNINKINSYECLLNRHVILKILSLSLMYLEVPRTEYNCDAIEFLSN